MSVSSTGQQANGPSTSMSLSADGRFVAFVSEATNLVPGDSNGVADIFVRDRMLGTTVRVSVGPGGVEANGASSQPSMGPEGRYVAFSSVATNLVANDTNGAQDIFVYDLMTGQTSRVSVVSGGTEAMGESRRGSLSLGGRYVVFESDAPNLAPGDTDTGTDVFVYDRQTNQTQLVSVSSPPGPVHGGDQPSISNDDRYVAFGSALALVPEDTSYSVFGDIFVYDRQAGQTTRVSTLSDGSQNGGCYISPGGFVGWMQSSISPDGRYVTFGTLLCGANIFAKDRQTGQLIPLTVDSSGRESDGTSLGESARTAGLCSRPRVMSLPRQTPTTGRKTHLFVTSRRGRLKESV